jgi:hypothetical protein
MKNKNVKLTIALGVSFGLAMIAAVTLGVMSFIMYQEKKQGSFDNLSFSNYKSQYVEFDYLRNYEFLYCYGDVNKDDIDSALSDFAAWFPITFPQFLVEGGVIILTNDVLGMAQECFNLDYNDGDKLRGFFLTQSDRPVICINLNEPSNYDDEDLEMVFGWFMESTNTPIHEMAHYIDYKNEYSSTDEFKEYFNKYAVDYDPKNAVIEGYQSKDEKEFFAVLYTDILRNSYNEKYIIPSDLKEFMLKVIGEEM